MAAGRNLNCASCRGGWGERSCPRNAAIHPVAVDRTPNLPVERRTLYHWAMPPPLNILTCVIIAALLTNVSKFSCSCILLRSEIPSGMCAPWQQATIEIKASHRGSKQQSRSPDEITLLLLVRTTHIYFCSSRTSHSWWITQSTQRHRRGCNNSWRLAGRRSEKETQIGGQ